MSKCSHDPLFLFWLHIPFYMAVSIWASSRDIWQECQMIVWPADLRCLRDTALLLLSPML